MLSKTEAAYKILKVKRKPLHLNEIIDIAIRKNMIRTKGKTPASTLGADLYAENKRRKKQRRELRFRRVGQGVWALTTWTK